MHIARSRREGARGCIHTAKRKVGTSQRECVVCDKSDQQTPWTRAFAAAEGGRGASERCVRGCSSFATHASNTMTLFYNKIRTSPRCMLLFRYAVSQGNCHPISPPGMSVKHTCGLDTTQPAQLSTKSDTTSAVTDSTCVNSYFVSDVLEMQRASRSNLN